MKININIDTNKKTGKLKYADVAFFIDRGDFLKDLSFLRRKWRINKLFNYNRYDDWRKKALTPTDKQRKAMDVAWKNFQKKWQISLGNIPSDKAREDWKKTHMLLPEWAFYFDIDKIRSKYNKPYYFHWIIRRILVCGEIRDEDYKTVSIYQIGAPFSSGWFTGLPIQAAALIAVNKETTENELLNIFHEFKKTPAENTYEKYLKISSFNKDTISNIKRNREWYWKNISNTLGGEGKSYLVIAKEEAKSREDRIHLYRDTIAKAIPVYKKILNRPLVET